MLFIPLTFVNIGKGNAVCATKVKYMTLPKTAPGFRMVRIAKKEGRFVDATNGKPTKTLIVLDDDTVIACPYSANTTLSRFKVACMDFLNNTDSVRGSKEWLQEIRAHMRVLESMPDDDPKEELDPDEPETELSEYERDFNPLEGLEEADDEDVETDGTETDGEEEDAEETEDADEEDEEPDEEGDAE